MHMQLKPLYKVKWDVIVWIKFFKYHVYIVAES